MAKQSKPYGAWSQNAQRKLTTNEQDSIMRSGKKGTRVCGTCGIPEEVALAYCDRYSLCRGMCVWCYGENEKGSGKARETVPQTRDEIDAQIARLVTMRDEYEAKQRMGAEAEAERLRVAQQQAMDTLIASLPEKERERVMRYLPKAVESEVINA